MILSFRIDSAVWSDLELCLLIELQNPSLRALIGRRALLAPIRDLCDREG